MFKTDQIQWYNNGVWGELGFAAPNFGDDPTTINSTIHYLVTVLGRNLQAIMLHTDANLTRPPSINTLTRVHMLIIRARGILAGRSVPPSKLNMEAVHATPVPEVFNIFPCPYFKVRNQFMKEWGGLALMALTEATQHTENARAYEVSTDFAGLMGQYLHRVYKLMATELFGVSVEEADALDFTLSDELLGSYEPGQFFTSTEMVDVVPTLQDIPTEDDLRVLTAGIPATEIVCLQAYPNVGAFEDKDKGKGKTSKTSGKKSATSKGSFAKRPGA